MITALALMIAVAGYMQFSGDNLSKENLADGEADNMEEYSATLDFTVDGEELTELDIVTDEEDVITMLDMDLSDVNMAGDTYASNEDIVGQMENGDSSELENVGEAVYTSTTAQMSLSDAKLLKEQSRAQNKAGLLEIINNAQLTESAKQSAVENLVKLTDVAERELAAEILLEAKGFDSAIVSISGNSADVVLSSADLTDAKRAQVEDIVTRKTGVLAENIIISAVVEN